VKILGAEMIAAAARAEQFPVCDLPEVAFLGRSNVGKSSLLNRLAQRRKLARTSSTPGKTRLIHWYAVRLPERELRFVDLPGYGYARVSKAERVRWRVLVESYLADRATLRGAILLHDARRDPTDDEELLIEWLRQRDVPVVLAITKVDKLGRMQRDKRVAAIRRDVDLPSERIVATSAEKGTGIEDLWRLIDALTT
jgi:GTP-binding protein